MGGCQRLLVTGSSGRLGRAVCARLAAEHEVRGWDRARGSPTTFLGDLGDASVRRTALAGVDAVLHLAGLHAPDVGRSPDAEFRRINVQATLDLAVAAAAAGATRFILASTTALYGVGGSAMSCARWIDEDTLPHPSTIYHRTKLDAEAALADAAERFGLTVTLLRLSRCFPEPAPQMAVYRLHRGVDARDVAEAHAAALAWRAPGQTRCLVISGATPFERGDLGELAVDASAVVRRRAPGLAAEFDRRGWRLPTRIDRVYDPSRAQATLAWQPRFGFEAVLAQADAADPAVLPAAEPLHRPERLPEPCA